MHKLQKFFSRKIHLNLFCTQAPYNDIRYSLIGDDNAPSFFEIDESDGNVLIKRSLNDDSAAIYKVRSTSDNLMASSHENTFRITGLLWGKSLENSLTEDQKCGCFLCCWTKQAVNKQQKCRWFESPEGSWDEQWINPVVLCCDQYLSWYENANGQWEKTSLVHMSHLLSPAQNALSWPISVDRRRIEKMNLYYF